MVNTQVFAIYIFIFISLKHFMKTDNMKSTIFVFEYNNVYTIPTQLKELSQNEHTYITWVTTSRKRTLSPNDAANS